MTTHIPQVMEKLPKGAIPLKAAAERLGVEYGAFRKAALAGKFATLEFGKVGRGVGRFIREGVVSQLQRRAEKLAAKSNAIPA